MTDYSELERIANHIKTGWSGSRMIGEPEADQILALLTALSQSKAREAQMREALQLAEAYLYATAPESNEFQIVSDSLKETNQ